MTSPFRAGALTRVVAARTTTTPLAAAAAVRVDLEQKKEPETATILRGGREVATARIDPSRLAAALEGFTPTPRVVEARSVRQSIAAGTLVAKGTTIDIDLLPPAQVSIGIFEAVHTDLRLLNVSAVFPLLQDPEVANFVARGSAEDLTEAEKQNLTAKLGTINVRVDPTSPDSSLGAAFRGLKSAQAFR